VNSGKPKLKNVQVLRGILFLGILLFHAGAPFASMMWGVECFFVISAYFLTRKKLCENSFRIIEQTKHRVLRLLPEYICIILLAFVLSIMVGRIPWDVISYPVFLQDLLWIFTNYTSPMQPLMAHTWTLPIEVWCGLLLTIILAISNKRYIKRMFIGLFVLGIAFREICVCFNIDALVLSLIPISHIDAFAVGGFTALNLKKSENDKIPGVVVLALGLIGIFGSIFYLARLQCVTLFEGYTLFKSSSNYLNNWFTVNIYSFISLTCAGILMLIINNNQECKSKILEPLVWLGDNSYAGYMFHWPIRIILVHFFRHWIIVFIADLLLTIIACELYKIARNKIKLIIRKKK